MCFFSLVDFAMRSPNCFVFLLVITLCVGLPSARTQPVQQERNQSSDTTAITTASITPSIDGRVFGWIGQPNSRGTIDILWDSVFTIFISTYTILTLNVPSRWEPRWSYMGRRLLWMGVSIAGPEFVLTAAAGQRAAAKRSVEKFRAAGYRHWTMRHAFFADMGGIELRARESPPFRINATHLYWLVTHGYLPFPDIPLEEIWDKSKADTIAKVLTTMQICYLILQCVGRAAQHLAITTLELFALAIVVCSIATSWCWLRKPVDVQLPIIISMDTPIRDILIQAGPEAARPYQQTPMDFIDDLKPSWSLNIQTFMRMPIGPFERPISRFGNDRFPWLELPQSTALSFATMVYAAVHVAAWNWTFPSRKEAILWRVSSLIIFGSTVAFWIFETIAVWYRWNGGEKRVYALLGKSKQFEELEKARQEATSEPRQLPLKGEFWSMFVLACVYGAARMYLLVEAF